MSRLKITFVPLESLIRNMQCKTIDIHWILFSDTFDFGIYNSTKVNNQSGMLDVFVTKFEGAVP